MSKNVCGMSEITGVSFSLHPMCDSFVEVIKGAIEASDTSKVWLKTDDVTTTLRGKAVHIFDVSKAIFMHAAKTGHHIAFNASYSVGCPGDTETDKYMAKDEEPANLNSVQAFEQMIAAKFALYPLGGGEYMDIIYKQIDAMKQFVKVTPVHYATRLDGDANHVFAGLEQVFNETVKTGSSHTVMTVSISANSPSHVGELSDD